MLPVGDPRHGSVNGYTNYGCRCPKCVDTMRRARRGWPSSRVRDGVIPAAERGLPENACARPDDPTPVLAYRRSPIIGRCDLCGTGFVSSYERRRHHCQGAA